MPESMWLSPGTMLLRLYVDRIRLSIKSEQLGTLLKNVLTETHILRSNTSVTSLDSLVLSLQDSEDWKASGRVFEYLDHCILRLVRKPVHYFDILAELIATSKLEIDPRDCQVDLLLIAILDQWRFLVESVDVPTVINVSKWLLRYIEIVNLGNGYIDDLQLREKATRLLSQILDQLKSQVQDTTCRAIFEKTLEEQPQLVMLRKVVAADAASEARHTSRPADPTPKTRSDFPETFLPPGPPDEYENHPGLHQWTRHEVQDAISEGHIKSLILCLCSRHVEIRKQALTCLRTFMMKLEVR